MSKKNQETSQNNKEKNNSNFISKLKYVNTTFNNRFSYSGELLELSKLSMFRIFTIFRILKKNKLKNFYLLSIKLI